MFFIMVDLDYFFLEAGKKISVWLNNQLMASSWFQNYGNLKIAANLMTSDPKELLVRKITKLVSFLNVMVARLAASQQSTSLNS